MVKTIRAIPILLMLFILSNLKAQDTSCPSVPSGLNNISDLQWVEEGHIATARLGNNPQSLYLQSWLEWDVFSGDLRAVTAPETLKAVQLAEMLGIADDFFSSSDTTRLRVAPSMQFAIYITESPLPHTLYSVDTSNMEITELGRLSANLSQIFVTWLPNDEAIIVGEPIYGPGYDVVHVCLDGSCFIDLPELAGTFVDKPTVNVGQETTVYNSDNSILMLYSLQVRQ
jgi:hypothetical protein